MSNQLKETLSFLSSSYCKERVETILTNDKINDDKEVCLFYFGENIFHPNFTKPNDNRGFGASVFSIDAEWISAAYLAAIYQISPHQAIVSLQQKESSKKLLTSIDPYWEVFLKNPRDLSKDELLMVLEKYPHYICHCHPLFTRDIEFIKQALTVNFSIFDFVDDSIKRHPEFVTECLTKYFDPGKYSHTHDAVTPLYIGENLSELFLTKLSNRFDSVFDPKDKNIHNESADKILSKCMRIWAFRHPFQLSDDLKFNKTFQMKCIRYLPQAVQDLPDQLKQDGAFILSVLQHQPLAYSYLDTDTRKKLPLDFYRRESENPTCCDEHLIKYGPSELFGHSKSFCLRMFSNKTDVDPRSLYFLCRHLSSDVIEHLFDSKLPLLSGPCNRTLQIMLKDLK